MAAGEADSGEGFGQRHRARATRLSTYFDTSAIVKLLLDESGAAAAGAAWDDARSRTASVALLAEARAALGAAQRDGRLSSSGHREAVEELAGLWLEIDGIVLTEDLAMRAGELAETFALRGYDAVHLASAEAIADPDMTLVTADRDLASAAASLGMLAVVPAV
jgi:predicted nucleic acid-binding protein